VNIVSDEIVKDPPVDPEKWAPEYSYGIARADPKNKRGDPYPINYPALRLIKGVTIYRHGMFWSAILLVRYRISKEANEKGRKGRLALKFYRWEMYKNKKDNNRMYWRKSKQWSINRPGDWKDTHEIITRHFVQDWTDLVKEDEEEKANIDERKE
jgi:hypothetical protein